jgi:hypothetical protein
MNILLMALSKDDLFMAFSKVGHCAYLWNPIIYALLQKLVEAYNVFSPTPYFAITH